MHECFDKKGPDAAHELGLKLKLKPGTLKSWFGMWGRAKPEAAPKKSTKASKVKASANGNTTAIAV